MVEPGSRIAGGDGAERVAECRDDRATGAGRGAAHLGFELGKQQFGGIEIRRIGRQIHRGGCGSFPHLYVLFGGADPCTKVYAEVRRFRMEKSNRFVDSTLREHEYDDDKVQMDADDRDPEILRKAITIFGRMAKRQPAYGKLIPPLQEKADRLLASLPEPSSSEQL